jgi:hypothetical protein
MTNRASLLLLIIFFFQSLLSLPAQSGHYVIEQRFIQRIVWVDDEYVLKYEVVIERDDGEGYRVFMREFTESSVLEISLFSGNYRYQVIPFDFLEQPGEASEWVTLDVLPAPAAPAEVQTAGNTNDGRISIYGSAVWAPLLPLYGGMQQIYGNGFYASGAALRCGMIFSKLTLFDPGLELLTSWYALNHDQDDYIIGIQTGVIGFNILAQKWLPNGKMAVTFRTGGGLGFQVGELNSGQDLYPMGVLVPQINLEPSFLWQVLKQLYLETGLGYTFYINQSGHSGCLRPWLGIGWNF